MKPSKSLRKRRNKQKQIRDKNARIISYRHQKPSQIGWILSDVDATHDCMMLDDGTHLLKEKSNWKEWTIA